MSNNAEDDDLPEIHQAILSDDKVKIIKLLEYGTDIEERDSADKTGLFIAAQTGKDDLVKLLLERGAEVDARSNTGYTPLHTASEMGYPKVASLLIHHKADINARESEWGSTPLIISSFWGYSEIVSLLLKADADPSICAYFDYSPLGCAAVKGHFEVAKVLIAHKKGVDLETTTNNGYTPLLNACANAYVDIVDLLLNNGADIYATDKTGTSVLHVVSAKGNPDLLKKLIKHLANIKAKDNNGNTPLHTAVINGHLPIVKLLIQSGIDKNCQNNKGYAPLHVAAEKGNSEIVKYLQTLGADAKLRTEDNYTAVDLAYCAEHKYVEEVLKLVSKPSENIEAMKAGYQRQQSLSKGEGSGRSANGPVPAPRRRTSSGRGTDPAQLSLRKGSTDSTDTYSTSEHEIPKGRNKIDSGYMSFEPQPNTSIRRPAPKPPIANESKRHTYVEVPNILKDPNKPESHYHNLEENDIGTNPPSSENIPPPSMGMSTHQSYQYETQTQQQYDTQSTNQGAGIQRVRTIPADHHHSEVHPDSKKKSKNPFYKFFNKHKKTKDESKTVSVDMSSGRPSQDVTSSMNKNVQSLNIDNSLKEVVSSVYIDFDRLILEDLLGRGNFGRVYLGRLKTSQGYAKIAVKTTKYRADEVDMIDMFLKEALIMKDFKHAHVLSLIGITFDLDANPLALIPFMNHGNLRAYIRDPQRALSVQTLLKLGLQAGRGMEYLSKNKFVHRDLACRNCMIDQQADNIIVKVADFGLSRDLYSKDYYRITDRSLPLPVRWMAPESMKNNIFKLKSDVWSFGVLLWELLTRGAMPYGEVENWDIEKYIMRGRRLDKPKYCPDLIYGVMQSCWNIDGSMRPSFADIVISIEDHMHNEMVSSNQVDPADQLMGAKKMYFV